MMTTKDLRIGMRVRHPGYGTGKVVGIERRTCEILFDDGNKRTVAPDDSRIEPIEAQAEITGLTTTLERFVRDVVAETADALGLERPDAAVDGLLPRWIGGTLKMEPQDASLQAKEVPIEAFFHKIVMMRNNLRVLEQKINAHPDLDEGSRVELQQYVTRCYGSMTTFNVLFREKSDQFSTK